MTSESTRTGNGWLARVFKRGALAVALMGLVNAAIVFWFLERTEAHGTTILLVGRQQALVLELYELAAARTAGDHELDRAFSLASTELDASMTVLVRGGFHAGMQFPPPPADLSPQIERLAQRWDVLKGEIAVGGDLGRARSLTESFSRDANTIIATLEERDDVYRKVLAGLAGTTTVVVLAMSFLAAYFIQTRLADPASRLVALARGAVERKPSPTLELPPNHELGGALEAVSDLSARLEAVRSERDVAQADYDAIFGNSLAGIYRIDADNRVSLANDALAEILGYASADELVASVQQAHHELFVGTEHRDRFAASEEIERFPVLETKMRRKDGREIWVLESARRSRVGGSLSYEGVVFDITPRKRAFDALRRLTGRLMEIQDEERRRLARELHDSMGQLLAAMRMNLTRLDDTLELDDASSELLRDSLELSEEASRQTRTMSHLLHPPLLEELGLEHAIRDFAAGYQERSGITVEVNVAVPERLSSSLETCLFRFVQECLTNVHRHSGSERAEIRLFRRDGMLYAQCEDEGAGMPESVWRGDGNMDALGVGLRGMSARLDQLDGRLEIESSSSGTIVTAVVRLPNGTEPPPP